VPIPVVVSGRGRVRQPSGLARVIRIGIVVLATHIRGESLAIVTTEAQIGSPVAQQGWCRAIAQCCLRRVIQQTIPDSVRICTGIAGVIMLLAVVHNVALLTVQGSAVVVLASLRGSCREQAYA